MKEVILSVCLLLGLSISTGVSDGEVAVVQVAASALDDNGVGG